MGGVSVATIISIAMFFVKLFIQDKSRQQQIKNNMDGWFNVKAGKGSEIADGMTELEKQEDELRKSRGQ